MSVCGSPVKKQFSRLLDKKGRPYFKITGEVNLDDEIQSHRLDCDVNYIVSRYAAGDVTALNRMQGFFGDITEAPRSLAEQLNRVNQARDVFEHLPADVREQFDGNFEKFFISLDQPGTIDILSKFLYPDQVESGDSVVKETNVDES